MPTNDTEVFDYLTSSSEIEIDYLTYALFAHRKRQWIDHFKSRYNQGPNQKDIDGWIVELTTYDFFQMRAEAAEFFKNAAEAYLEKYIEEQKQQAVEGSILSEVRKFTSPTRHVLIALLMAIVAPIILGGVIFLFSLFDRSFPIHFQFVPASQSTQEK